MQGVNSPAFLYGESLFTTTRVLAGKALFWSAHLERIASGIEQYYLGRRLEADERKSLEQKALDSLAKALKQWPGLGEKEARWRLTICAPTRDELFLPSHRFEDLIFSSRLSSLPARELAVKLKSFPSPYTQAYPHMKMGSYMPALWLKALAARDGADDALLLDEKGNILEGASSNVFFFKGERLFAPRWRLLEGTIKREIEKICKVEKLDIAVENAGEFDGAFLTNSACLIQPVERLDHIHFKDLNEEWLRGMLEELLRRGYE